MRALLTLCICLLLGAPVAFGDPPADAAGQAAARTVRMVSIETRLLRMPEGTARRLLGSCLPCGPGRVALLNDVGRARLLAAVERGGVVLVTSPRITLYDGQRGNVSALNQMAYLKEYAVKREGEAQVATPVIDTVQDGVVVDLRPFVQADGRGVTLDLTVTTSTLQRPLAKIPVVVAGKAVEIQVPEHTTHTVRRLLRLRPGTHGLVRGAAGAWVLVTAKALALPDPGGAEIDLVPSNFVPPDFEPPVVPGR